MQRRKLLVIVLVVLFFGPLAISFTWYFGLDHVRPAPTAQKGELIDPARPLPRVSLPTPREGESVPPDFLEGHWSIVYFGTGDCAAACRERLLALRQMRAALGRERGRVRQVFLYTGEATARDWLYTELPLAVVASVDTPDAAALLAAFPGGDATALAGTGAVYFVDPLGNLMMRYQADTPLRDMHDDLTRLLRLSRIG